MENSRLENDIEFKGQGGEFFGIWIVNVLLTIVTLGIYSAWAKVRTKRYFYGNTFLAGDSFEYHALPMQILKGRLVAVAILILWMVANAISPIASFILLILFYIALPWLLWSNARFDAAMTSYRNVRFSFNTPLKDMYLSLIGRGIGSMLIVMTYFAIAAAMSTASPVLGGIMFTLSVFVIAALYGWVVAGIQRLFANGYQYGDWKFSANIDTGLFVKAYLKAVLLGLVGGFVLGGVAVVTLVTDLNFTALQEGSLPAGVGGNAFWAMFIFYAVMFGLSITLAAYIKVFVRNHVFSQLKVNHEEQAEEYGFDSRLTVLNYMWFVISNFLLLVFTLGLCRAWIMVRTSRYFAEHTSVYGDMTLLEAQGRLADDKSAVTDELAQTFDVGIELG